MTVRCRDADLIPKSDLAGQVVDGVQLMHNGVKVRAGCYYGAWMTELIRQLRGHHEPQEELAFHLLVERLRQEGGAPVMVECAAFWGYYSLWLLQRIPGATAILVEPDPGNLDVGRENFRLNERSGVFVNAAVGGEQVPEMPFLCESDMVTRLVPCESLPSLWKRLGLQRLDVLHIDAQGAEVLFLESGREILAAGLVRFCVVSTHHHSISSDPLGHERCVRLFAELGAHVVAEHTVAESFSGDGLVCVSFEPRDRDLVAPISRARARESQFGDPLVDLAECRQGLDGVRHELEESRLHLREEEARRADAERTLTGAVRRRVRRWVRARRQ